MRNRTGFVLAAALVLSVAVEALFIRGHHVPGFHAVVGLGSCVGVVWLTKVLGRAFLQKPGEDDGV